MISNSEVDCAQLTVEPFPFRLPYTNYLIVAEEVAVEHRHLHFTPGKFGDRIVPGPKGQRGFQGAVQCPADHPPTWHQSWTPGSPPGRKYF